MLLSAPKHVIIWLVFSLTELVDVQAFCFSNREDKSDYTSPYELTVHKEMSKYANGKVPGSLQGGELCLS